MTITTTRRAVAAATRYYASRLWNRATPSSLEHFSTRTIEICKPDLIPAIRPYFRENQLARISDSPSLTASQLIDDFLKKPVVELYPVKVHEFRDAYLVDGSVYINNSIRVELRSTSERGNGLQRFSIIPRQPRDDFDEAVLAAGVAGSTWFGHWLEDEVPMQMLAMAYGKPIAHLRSEYAHEPRYRDLLKLVSPTRVGTAQIRRLTYVDEFAQNPSKARRYWRIRETLARLPKGSERVFLNRGASGVSRPIANEDEIISLMRNEGFAIVDVTASLNDILRSLNQASLVVSVEGSHLAHALYAMQRGGTMVILNPPYQAHTTVADIAPFCELHAGMFIGTPDKDGSFNVAIDELLSFIDETVADNERRRSEIERFHKTLREYPVSEP